jgi:uncharacterized membrane protein
MVPRSDPAAARLRFLDAARGVSMFFVLLSHFAGVYFIEPEQEAWRSGLIRIGMIATPTFMILSGMVLGVQYDAARAGFARIQARFIDRGLFLLLLGHVAISLALQRVEQGAFVVYTTDIIGAAMILGALLVPKLGGRSRLYFSLTAYAASWLAVYFWHPAPGGSTGETIKELMFGSLRPTALPAQSFPVVPWLAVYAAGSVLGERLSALVRSGAMRRLAGELTVLGVAGVVAMAGIKLAALALGLSPLRGAVTSALLRVGQKSPPAPLYLLFYCGIGMLLIGVCFVAENRGWFRRAFRCAVVCGEASLFLFLAHFYLFWIGLYRLDHGGPGRGLVYFALSMTLLVTAARIWQRRHYNRLFTVRYEIGRDRFVRAFPQLQLTPDSR